MSEVAKCTIKETGEVEFEGNFSREKLITILRRELIYQKEAEKLLIKENLENDRG